MPYNAEQKRSREAAKEFLRSVICPERAGGQLHSPREAESGIHGENESSRIFLPEIRITFFGINSGQKPSVCLVLKWEPSRQITRAQNISYHMNPVLLSAHRIKFWDLTQASSEGRHKREAGKKWGRGSSSWGWNDSLTLCLFGGEGGGRRASCKGIETRQIPPALQRCGVVHRHHLPFRACLWRSTNQLSCDVFYLSS